MLFKRRSKFGEFIDRTLGFGGQERLRDVSKVSRETIRKACNDADYKPTGSIRQALVAAVRKLTGKDVDPRDFWM